MNLNYRDAFIERFGRYFPGAELPVCFFYSSTPAGAAVAAGCEEHRCLIGDLMKVRKGTPLAVSEAGAVCGGAKRYLGFAPGLRENFEYFLSYGIEGVMEGERYKKSPEIVKQLLNKFPVLPAPEKYIVFKRFDQLEENDKPQVAVFFATPDVLSGLFTLSGYDESEIESVIAPFAAGCGSIVQHPYKELVTGKMRAVLGMFDVSARPCVHAGELTFAVPWPRFLRMAANMQESFLITGSWKLVKNRMENAAARV